MKKLLLLLASLLSFSTVQADNIYVAPIKGSHGVSKDKLETLRELIKVHVQEFPQHQVVSSLEKADFYLQTKLIKFENFTLSMSRWKGREKVVSGQWKASSMAELETVSEKAVRHMVNTEESKGAILVGSKSQIEDKTDSKTDSKLGKIEAPRQVLIGFGPGFFSNMNSPDTAFAFQAGYFWNISNNIDMGLQTDLSISTVHSEASLFMGKIVGNYFFLTNEDISPYVGGGFGYGWSNAYDAKDVIDDDTSGGFSLSVQAGAKFFRTSTVNFGLSAEYSQILDENSLGNPSLFLVRVGVYY